MNEIDKAMHAALQQVHPDLVAALEHAVALGGTRSAAQRPAPDARRRD